MPIVHVVAVQDKVIALLRMADDAAASMNNELRVQLVKIPKQVTAILDLFNLHVQMMAPPSDILSFDCFNRVADTSDEANRIPG